MSEADSALRVVLCWHMHQPSYKDVLADEYALPWVYLHALKDYLDMAVHLEAHPQVCAVVNFSPVLIEQIEDYSAQVNGWLRHGAAIKDPALRALVPDASQPAPQDEVVRRHLNWLGETAKRGDPRVQELLGRSESFTSADRLSLLQIIGEVLTGLLPRYRRLMGAGQVELAISPWSHPILPLMLGFSSAHEAWPEAQLPGGEYPGGDDRASWHIARALQTFTRVFGVRPHGCWPAEGAVSTATLTLLERFGLNWTASSEQVLRNSLGSAPLGRGALHRAFHLPGQRLRCFFRHDGLSDRIGFTYAGWRAEDAVANLLHELEQLQGGQAEDGGHPGEQVVSIVMDGENAWEHYPSNAFDFLDGLYRRLSEHPRLRTTTFSQCLAEGLPARELPRLTAGSWVQGTFSTWIGQPAKNRAWQMLCEAKQMFDQVVVEGNLSQEQERAAERQLGVCEGSDWFWWPGEQHPPAAVEQFDDLFRRHLKGLYSLLGEQVPGYLEQPFAYQPGSGN